MRIVAFGHAKNVGKDTAARFLISHLRTSGKYKNVHKAGFADKLKAVCWQLYNWAGLMPGDWYEQSADHRARKEIVLPELGKSPRQIWIEVGNLMRQVYAATWIDYLLKVTSVDVLIISDMRYPNEADRILELGGLVVKIERPDQPHTSDVADDALLGYDKWSYTIVNDGGLNDLYGKVIKLVEEKL